MARVVFRSKHKQLRVHFDPRRFGLMDSPDEGDYLTDVSGRAVTQLTDDPNAPGKQISVPVRRKVAKPAAQFYDSMLALDDSFPMQRAMIEDLRKTISGAVTDKRGKPFMRPDELWEERPATTALLDQLNGAIIVTIPDPVTDEDREILASLETYFHNTLPYTALNGAMAMFDKALARFQVRGIVSPTPERAHKQLRPRIIDLCYALADAAAKLDIALPLKLEKKVAQGA